jgi:hypothetical protein
VDILEHREIRSELRRRPGRRSTTKMLIKDEARRIAANCPGRTFGE